MQYFIYNKDSDYPDDCYYRPSKAYPEYQYESEGYAQSNDVYDMFRQMLINLELDKANIGLSNWNPFGTLIKQGNTVLIKPNLVLHKYNKTGKGGLNCTVTHPSIIRCIIDYVIIALNGTGKIIIADAPVQECNFDVLMRNGGYYRIIEFYKHVGINLTFEDLRLVAGHDNLNFKPAKERMASYGSRSINLGDQSYFSHKKSNKLRITNYSSGEMNKYHSKDKHEYCISSICLDADVIISIPKPKSHKLAGYTGALKNMIGVISRKECLPHHTKGAKSLGGDEYRKGSILRQICSNLYDIKNYAEKKEWTSLAMVMDISCDLINKRTNKKDATNHGAWYGNDTIWRTILDLNYIIKYSDKNGIICNTEQRKVISIGDMIICGEGDGPLNPSPKKVGGILISDDPVIFDAFLIKIMGFNPSKIPVFRNIIKNDKLFCKNINQIYFNSNCDEFKGKLKEIKKNYKFIPTIGWDGIINKFH